MTLPLPKEITMCVECFRRPGSATTRLCRLCALRESSRDVAAGLAEMRRAAK